jgi:putative PIN family toxin of toxin-antitoxin system
VKRVIVDTNVWVSALINPFGLPAEIRKLWKEDRFDLLISQPLLVELVEVLNRPRIKDKYGLSPDDVLDLLQSVILKSSFVAVTHEIDICRDAGDNMVLETAIKGKANYLVTRDDDIKMDKEIFRELKKLGVEIVSVSKFLQAMMTGG